MIPQKFSTVTIGEFFGKLFNSRDVTHLTHLRINGGSAYSAHRALFDYYEKVVDLIDSLVESYQGKYGLVDIVIDKSVNTEPLGYLEELARYIETNRVKLIKDSYLDNQVDTILELIYSTIYKLKFLK